MALKYEVNKVKIDLSSYRFFIRGIPKIGKTTFFRDFILEQYGDPKFGLLISVGQENGYKALTNITAIPCVDWASFTEVVDDLVENKADNEFKFVCIDTIDRVFEIAEDRVLVLHRQQKGESAFSIDAALGGFAKGKAKARVLVEKEIARLENAGYGMMWLGHTKLKSVGDQTTDAVYEKVTGSLEFKYDALFSDRADFTVMVATESVVKEDKLVEAERYIYFRSTPTIDAGSRIAAEFFPVKIKYSARGFIDTVTKALESTAGVSGKDAEKLRKAEQKELAEKAVEFSKADKVEKLGDETLSLEDYIVELVVMAKGLSAEDKEIKQAELKEKKLPSSPKAFKEITDMALAVEVHKILAS